MKITIDPTHLSAPDALLLKAFLGNHPEQPFWKKGVPYQHDDIEITLTNDIVSRKRKEGQIGLRYEVMSDEVIGTGGTSKIYAIQGTLTPTDEGFRFRKQTKNHHCRVMKVINSTFSDSFIMKEFAISKSIEHLAMKEPTWVGHDESRKAYITMRRLAGLPLSALLDDIRNGKITLTIQQRYELTKELLKALEAQVTSKSLVHHDIKPDNIMISLTADAIHVSILDFGGSIDAASTEPFNDHWGTRGYRPARGVRPGDSIDRKLKYDVFSMARVLALVWGDDAQLFSYHPHDWSYPYYFLFSGISGISYEQTKDIKSLLLKMSKTNPDERLSIHEAIRQCETFASFRSEERLGSAEAPKDYFHQLFLGDKKTLESLTKEELLVCNTNGELPAFIATREGHAPMVSLLCKKKAIPTHDTRWKEFQVEDSSFKSYFNYGAILMHLAILKGHAEVVDILSKQGISIGFIGDNALLLPYLVKHHYSGILHLLNPRADFDVDKKDREGWTLAAYAACTGEIDVLKELHRLGANLVNPTIDGATLACIAAQQQQIKVLSVLNDLGVDLNIKMIEGITPAYLAAQNGHVDVIRQLNKLHANLNIPNDKGITPAYMAAQEGQLAALKELRRFKVDLNKPMKDGSTLAHIAAENNHIEIITYLIQQGVSVNRPLTLSREVWMRYFDEHKNPAILARLTAKIDQLIAQGCDESKIALLPIDVAAIMGNQAIVDLLQSQASIAKAAVKHGIFSCIPLRMHHKKDKMEPAGCPIP